MVVGVGRTAIKVRDFSEFSDVPIAGRVRHSPVNKGFVGEICLLSETFSPREVRVNQPMPSVTVDETIHPVIASILKPTDAVSSKQGLITNKMGIHFDPGDALKSIDWSYSYFGGTYLAEDILQTFQGIYEEVKEQNQRVV